MGKIMEKKGITLIALVITIIVMLILVAVTVTIAINGGLFNYARDAGVKTNEAMANEQIWASGKVNGKTIGEWVTGKNEYGFYYETPYSAILAEDTKYSVVFKRNNKIEYYMNGVPYKIEYWDLEFIPRENKITLNGIDGNFSQDGKTVTVPGELISVLLGQSVNDNVNFTTTFEEYHDIYYETNYYAVFSYFDGEGYYVSKDKKLYAIQWTRKPTKYWGGVELPQFFSHVLGDGINCWLISMDGREIYRMVNEEESELFATMNLKYPWIAPANANYQGILDGTPENYDEVVYEKYYYTYSQSEDGYIANLRDSTQTFDSNEVLSNIYGVPVVNKNQ